MRVNLLAFKLASIALLLGLGGCADSKERAVKAIEKQGLKPTVETFAAKAASGDEKNVALFLESELPYTSALAAAAAAGKLSTVLQILKPLEQKPERPEAVNLAFWAALESNQVDVASHLLAFGANTEATKHKAPALLHSLRLKSLDVAHLLLDKGVNVTATDWEGHTPLMAAARLGNVDLIQRLLEKGADFKVASKKGSMALHEAVLSDNALAVKTLIDAKADVNAPAGEEQVTPLHLAVSLGKPEIVDLLIAAGADMALTLKDGSDSTEIARATGAGELYARFKAQHYSAALQALSPQATEAAAIDLVVQLSKKAGMTSTRTHSFRELVKCGIEKRQQGGKRPKKTVFKADFSAELVDCAVVPGALVDQVVGLLK